MEIIPENENFGHQGKYGFCASSFLGHKDQSSP